MEETEEFCRKVFGLSGRARRQVRRLLTTLVRMRKDLPPNARTEAVRRLGWRLGSSREGRRASAEDSGPEPTLVPEGGDQIRKYLEEWQQKYRKSEERYRAERDEAFRPDDERARAEERLTAGRSGPRWSSSGSRSSLRGSACCGMSNRLQSACAIRDPADINRD